MNPTEQAACARQGAKPAAVPETGRFAVLCGLLGACGPRASKIIQGTSAPARKRSSGVSARWSSFTAVLVAAIFVLAAVGAAPASAAEVEHKFQSQITGLSLTEAFVHPWGLAFGEESNLFVADPGEEGVGPSNLDVFSAAGGSVARVGALAGGYTRSVAVSATTGDVYIADSGPDSVRVFEPMTKGNPALGYVELPVWTGEKTKHGSFGGGQGYVYVAVDNSSDAHAGDVYVMNTGNSVLNVIKPGESGGEGEQVQELLQVYDEGNAGAGLAVSPISGDVYVPTNEGAVHAVHVFNVEGKLQPELEPLAPAGSFTPTDVAVDPTTGEVYVVDGANHVVDEFSSRGEYEGKIADAKTGEPLGEPLGVAVSSSGQVYVSDATAKAVDVYGVEPPAPPVVESDSVLQVTDSSATFNAEIDPRDVPGDADTKYRFQYTTEERFAREGFTGAVSIPVPEGMLAPSFEVDHVSVPVQGLSAGTTYRFRVLVENGVGAAVQDTEHSFTTRTPGSFGLPDGREWEMVSPPQKQGVLIEPIEGIGDGQSGAELQAAVAGDAITYLADAPSESGPQGYSNFVQVLSTRGVSGWSSSDLPLPHSTQTGLSIGEGQEYRFFSEDLSGAIVQPFGAFDPSLSPEASEQTAFLRTDFSPGSVGEPCLPASMHCYRPLVTGKEGYANVPPGTVIGREFTGNACKAATLICGPQFVGASPDLSHVVLRSSTPLTPNGGEYGLYEWSAGRLQPVNLLPPNIEGKELPSAGGASLGHSRNGFRSSRDAVSADGSSVFWSWEGHLYMRDTVREKTIQLDVPESEPSCPAIDECGTGEIEAEFQLASSNGNVVFFLDTQKLTANGTAYGSRREEGTASGADLYECEISEDVCKLRDLAPAGGVVGSVLGASGDGQWVYFVANGVLAAGADAGSCPNSEEDEPSLRHVCNLYVSHDGVTSLVAVLSDEDKPDWGLEGVQTARVSPDGRWLAFMSQRSLTGYDNADAVSGRPDEEVYLYHAPENLASGPGDLACASCDPTGARPHGVEYGNGGPYNSEIPLVGGHLIWPQSTWLAGNIPTWTKSTGALTLYQSRYLSNSGRLFFNSSDALVPKDVNGTEDVYEYEPEGVPAGEHACSSASENGSDVFKSAGTVTLEEGTPGEHTVKEGAGCVALITDGTSSEESAFLDASETGGDVFFLTKAKLAPQDTDDALDVYDAQECTSKSPCAPPVAQAPVACNTEASCKAAPSPQPGIFGPAPSATFSGPGNLIPSPGVGKPAVRSLTRAQKLANALRLCKRDKNRSKRRACEKQAHYKYGASKAVKSANTNRRSK